MKVTHITDIDKFFEVIDSCKGRVELVTGEGDRLNLKSKLSQYVSLANIFSGGEIPELEIVAAEKETYELYDQRLIRGTIFRDVSFSHPCLNLDAKQNMNVCFTNWI
jgi:hypothetical protein